MKRVLNYTKPYLIMIIFAILLLFAQANADLALPDYLSKIVNVGIQQGGIENAVPIAIRESEMNRTQMFMTLENKSRVLQDYAFINSTSSDYEKYLKEYPVLENESIYVLKEISQDEIAALNPVMGRALLVVYAIEQAMSNPEQLTEMGSRFGINFSLIPPGMDVFDVLHLLNSTRLIEITNIINQQFDVLGETMIIQAATQPIRNEYAALGMNTDQLQTNYLLRTGGLMLLLTLLSVACTIVVGVLSARTAAGMGRDIRRDVFQKVESFSSAEFDRFSTASLITRSTNDITQIQMVIFMIIRMAFYAPIMGIGGIIRAVQKDASMTWIIAVSVLSLVSVILGVLFIALPKFKRIQKLIDRINLVAREHLSGMMVIRAFNRQKFEENRFDKANIDLTKVSLFINRVMVIVMPLIMFLMNGIASWIIWVGSHQVANAKMQVGDMIAFMQYTMQIVMSFIMLSMMLIILPRAAVSADRLKEILNTIPIIQDSKEPTPLPQHVQGIIEFRDVSFRYPGAEADALYHISFTAHPGQTTALIGGTGAGKSTIVNLIPRFYDVSSGSILIDGIDIRNITQHDLRSLIGYVPQKSSLFSGSIKSNLLFANENASEAEIQSAISIAQVDKFISARQEGMDAEIAQGGMNVSGGQKQRLSIARALVKKPPIYILDDSFSSLDFKTDAALRKSLKEEVRDSTVMIVTQRISTIKNAEQIIVMEDGKIVGKGTHQELMQICEYYKEIALSQLSMEELI